MASNLRVTSACQIEGIRKKKTQPSQEGLLEGSHMVAGLEVVRASLLLRGWLVVHRAE